MGMDLLDLMALVQPPMGGRRRSLSAGEHVIYALGTVIFPCLLFVLVLFAGLAAHPIATLALCVAFIVAIVLVARQLLVGTAQTIWAALSCAVACFICGGVALFLAMIASFYAEF
jgi:hypothetical protein